MNALVQSSSAPAGALVTHRDMAAVRHAMKTSLYPNATDEVVDMVLAYCEARGLDVMTKPVHVVPMWIPEKKKDGRVISPAGMRDVVMPGIGTYRIDAHRTGEYAGQDEVEYGPAITRTFRDGGRSIEVMFPEWARMTVYRWMRDVRVAYSARVYWLETYATAGRDTDAPNAMWRKRPYGQLEKCAEALALRKGFPEAVGSAPTAEEMEDKHFIDAEVVRAETGSGSGSGVIRMPAAKALAKPAERAAPATEKGAATDTVDDAGAEPGADAAPASEDGKAGIDLADGARRMLMLKAKQAGFFTEGDLLERFPRIGMDNLNAVLAELRKIQDANDGAAP